MKDISIDSVFDASAKTITFSKLSKIDIQRVLAVINLTDAILLYHPLISGKRGTASGNVLTLEYDTTSMEDTDKIQVWYQFPDDKAGISLGALSTFSNAFDDFTAAINNGAKTISLSTMPSLLSSVLGTLNMANLIVYVKKNGENTWNPLPYTSVVYTTNLLTFTGIDNFATGDEVIVMIQGPLKGYSPSSNAFQVEEQNVLGDASNNMMGTMRKPVNSATYEPTEYKNEGAATAANILAAAAAVMEFEFWNKSDADVFFQIHNKASTPSGGDTALVSIPVPARHPLRSNHNFYKRCTTGLSFAISSTDVTYTSGLTAADFKTVIRYQP